MSEHKPKSAEFNFADPNDPTADLPDGWTADSPSPKKPLPEKAKAHVNAIRDCLLESSNKVVGFTVALELRQLLNDLGYDTDEVRHDED